MKQLIKMLNALNKVEAISLEDQIIKKAANDTIFQQARKLYKTKCLPIEYKPGKGYVESK